MYIWYDSHKIKQKLSIKGNQNIHNHWGYFNLSFHNSEKFGDISKDTENLSITIIYLFLKKIYETLSWTIEIIYIVFDFT